MSIYYVNYIFVPCSESHIKLMCYAPLVTLIYLEPLLQHLNFTRIAVLNF